ATSISRLDSNDDRSGPIYGLRFYSSRVSLRTAPDGFWVSVSELPLIANSYWFPAPPIANLLLATIALVSSMLPVTVSVPVLAYTALNTAALSALVALSLEG